jgi:SAM-dependent methyltransferase
MFFKERIRSIKPGDRVLEIGPGATPHSRSDVLLEKQFTQPSEYERQFGTKDKLVTEKQVVFYSGDRFPFDNNSFDYVICSHVLEHVEDLPNFLSEVFRVSRRGYFEFPMIYYDYVYNIDAHLNFLNFIDGKLKYAIKKETPIYAFTEVQKFYFFQLSHGYVDTLNDLLPYYIQGFEWFEPFEVEKTNAIEELCHQSLVIPPKTHQPPQYSSKQLVKLLVKRIISKTCTLR